MPDVPSPVTRPVREGLVPIHGASLFCRVVGSGPPIVILHGGPDFDHTYLLPHLDVLAGSFRLIYYDQRGRGRSSGEAEEITIESEAADLDGVREHHRLPSMALLGHSFGALLAMEYALRHPDRVSHLILMNPAPASSTDAAHMRQQRHHDWPADMERMKSIAATPAFRSGDLETEATYYRTHYGRTVPAAELDPLLRRMRAHFTPASVLEARKIEDRLMLETWETGDYDLIPALQRLRVPGLVLHGSADFVPLSCAARIADAIPASQLVVVESTGHFSYLERPAEIARRIEAFLGTDIDRAW
jgi:proline iminopeptidase